VWLANWILLPGHGGITPGGLWAALRLTGSPSLLASAALRGGASLVCQLPPAECVTWVATRFIGAATRLPQPGSTPTCLLQAPFGVTSGRVWFSDDDAAAADGLSGALVELRNVKTSIKWPIDEL
jgi:hypothetical protein